MSRKCHFFSASGGMHFRDSSDLLSPSHLNSSKNRKLHFKNLGFLDVFTYL